MDMRNRSNSSGRRVALAALGGATLIGTLGAGLAIPASAAVPLIVVSSSPTNGVKIMGTDAVDTIVVTRAGTTAAPRISVDAATPLSIQVGCQPVPGDPTQALCTSPLASGGVFRQIAIYAGAGNDVISHGVLATPMPSLAVPMKVIGGLGENKISGGPGQDDLIGGPDDDTLSGGDAADELFGHSGDDTLDGGPGLDDELYGGPGNDTLNGGSGNRDLLDGGFGADRMDGGPGSEDYVSYFSRSTGVQVDLTKAGMVQGAAGEQDEIVGGVEDVFGGLGADTLHGDDGNNTLHGFGSEDSISGGRGKDRVFGGDGGDVLSGNVFGTPNSDGQEDYVDGGDDGDVCVESDADLDFVTCESVFVQN
jgi:Ca2+-binding RTX toxin-like protein